MVIFYTFFPIFLLYLCIFAKKVKFLCAFRSEIITFSFLTYHVILNLIIKYSNYICVLRKQGVFMKSYIYLKNLKTNLTRYKLSGIKLTAITTLTRLLSVLLAFVLAFSIAGCKLPFANSSSDDNNVSILDEISDNNASPTDNADFQNFVNDIFKDALSSDTISMHAYIENPASFGINDYEISLGRYDLDNLGSTTDISDALVKLQAFERSSLSSRQQLTYDELLQYFTTELEYADLYMFNTDLATTIGIQVQLPLLFAEYTFSDTKDIDEYIALLCDTDGYFKNMVDYETLRSKNGYFMEDTLVDEIIEQCQTFVDSANASDSVLISTFNEKIDSFSGLTQAQKDEYKARNTSAVSEHVVKGYQTLIDGLNSLKGTNRYAGGLSNYPDGDRYFEYLLKGSLGWSKSVDEYDALLDAYITRYMLSMQKLMATDATLSDKFSSFKFPLTKPDDILKDLKGKIADDFPAIPDVNYDIKYVSKALKDYASPAMYFIPQLDNLNVNSIYINSSATSDDSLYTTLAHEGYPGHLYQTQYFAATNPDWIRYIMSPGGYVEGWATYVELMSYLYAQSDNKNLNQLISDNYAVILCLYAKVDIGINYKSWKESDVASYIANFGFDDKDIAHEMYYAMISQPGNYCKYVLGCLGFNELKNTATTRLGDKFDLKEFHKFILDCGPIQFDILEKRLQIWILKSQS